jgi:hypothetical protein
VRNCETRPPVTTTQIMSLCPCLNHSASTTELGDRGNTADPALSPEYAWLSTVHLIATGFARASAHAFWTILSCDCPDLLVRVLAVDYSSAGRPRLEHSEGDTLIFSQGILAVQCLLAKLLDPHHFWRSMLIVPLTPSHLLQQNALTSKVEHSSFSDDQPT